MAPTQKPKKVLVAEDELAMREIVVEKLQSGGFNVTQAEDGAVAIKQIDKVKPDLILLDLMMPEVDGFGVLESLRKNPDPKIAATPVIILTNLWSKEEIIRTKNLGVKTYIIKAYMTTEEILDKVVEVLDAVEK
ncbi:MAG: response regulator [Candidatus Doudnabacteria bacterium]|nr:response regulator [Candidatus Doudnabacteria bacterium]